MKMLAVRNIRRTDADRQRQKLAAGVPGLDMYGTREPLAKAGLVHARELEED